MRAIIEDLDRVIAGGVEMIANLELEPSCLQDWLSRREQIFRELGNAPLDDDERHAVKSLIDEVLGLDATILSRLDARMTLLGAEIATAKRLKKFLASNASLGAPELLQRSL